MPNHFRPIARGIERTTQRRHDIGAGAPVFADRNPDLRLAFANLDGLCGQQPVAEHIDRQPSGRTGIDRDGHSVAGYIFGLVDGGLQQVRRVGAAVGIPADIERHRGQRPVGLRRLDVEAVTAGLRLQLDVGGLVGGDIDLTIGDALGRLDRLVFP
jgi:hypothetical protein